MGESQRMSEKTLKEDHMLKTSSEEKILKAFRGETHTEKQN